MNIEIIYSALFLKRWHTRRKSSAIMVACPLGKLYPDACMMLSGGLPL